MGKATGFLEFERQTPRAAAADDRISHWDEYYEPLSEEELRTQGARCMNCGVPFCHTGTLISGLASGCPLHNLIPEWNDLVYRGQWREALARLHKTNNFPEFTGRVCPAPCEGSCVLGLHDPAVAIKSIESAIANRGWDEGWIIPHPPQHRTGKRVAVIGSGPAGLACAAQLNQAGHEVVVYEKSDRAGGLLMYGIPNMKLDKRDVQRRVDVLVAEGVRFETNTEIGREVTANPLLDDNDAIVLCIGAGKPRDVNVEGRELLGIEFALDFLTENTKSVLDPKRGPSPINAVGKNVVVLGGGDTGTDCVATSMRHGCKSLAQLDIIPAPPDARMPGNPWPEWPKINRMDYGQEEAAAKFGDDPRYWQLLTKRFLGNDEGRVEAIETVQLVWEKDATGRFTFRELEGTEETWPADLVLLALGWLGPQDTILEQLSIERDARSNAKAEEGVYTTNVESVFAAGDVRRGASLVVWAINEGREAARECDRYLMGSTDLP